MDLAYPIHLHHCSRRRRGRNIKYAARIAMRMTIEAEPVITLLLAMPNWPAELIDPAWGASLPLSLATFKLRYALPVKPIVCIIVLAQLYARSNRRNSICSVYSFCFAGFRRLGWRRWRRKRAFIARNETMEG